MGIEKKQRGSGKRNINEEENREKKRVCKEKGTCKKK